MWKATRSRHLHHDSPLMTHKLARALLWCSVWINGLTWHTPLQKIAPFQCSNICRGAQRRREKSKRRSGFRIIHFFQITSTFLKKMTDIGEVDGKWPLWKRQCTGRQQPRAIWERAARDVNTFCSVKWPITVKPFGLPCCGGDGTEHSTAIHIFLRPETPAALLLKIMNTHTYSVEYESFFPKAKIINMVKKLCPCLTAKTNLFAHQYYFSVPEHGFPSDLAQIYWYLREWFGGWRGGGGGHHFTPQTQTFT